jgi:hypothetical protein
MEEKERKRRRRKVHIEMRHESGFSEWKDRKKFLSAEWEIKGGDEEGKSRLINY